MNKTQGKVHSIISNLVLVRTEGPVSQNEICFIQLGNERLMAEVIKVVGDIAYVQVFESTRGLKPGSLVEFENHMLEVTLGPGLLSKNFDGLQNDLDKMTGVFLKRGEYTNPLEEDKKWSFTPLAKVGDKVTGADWLGNVKENWLDHKIMVPFKLKGEYTIASIAAAGEYTIKDTIAVLKDEAGKEIPVHARIVAMADSYDAMSSRRIYRSALSRDVIYEEIRKNRGLQFDPEITDIFLKLMDENRLPKWDSDSEDTDSYNFPDMQLTVSKFISDIMATIKSQEDAKSYDFLTGLPMRNLGERLTAEFMQTHDGCLIFLDMDNLKKINDIYGHKAGDRALKCLGKLLQKRADQGISCRLGGDEFLMFLPDTDPDSLSLQMDDLFQKFHTITTDDPELRFATLSAGLCLCSTDDSFEDCYSKADKALYYVKQNGKNQFFFYQQIDRSTLAASGSGKDLELVAESLQKSGIYVGALDLNYRDFARQYEYMCQLVTRSQCRCYLAMITIETLVDTVPDIESIEQALEYMEQAIRQNIRRVDICTRYSSLQYLIILFEPDETHIPDIIERIFTQYYHQCDSHDFQPSYEYLEISPQEL